MSDSPKKLDPHTVRNLLTWLKCDNGDITKTAQRMAKQHEPGGVRGCMKLLVQAVTQSMSDIGPMVEVHTNIHNLHIIVPAGVVLSESEAMEYMRGWFALRRHFRPAETIP